MLQPVIVIREVSSTVSTTTRIFELTWAGTSSNDPGQNLNDQVASMGNFKLVPEDNVLQNEITSRSKANEEAADAKDEEFEHPAG